MKPPTLPKTIPPTSTKSEDHSNAEQQTPSALNIADEIKNLLRNIGTDELCLSNVERPASALWRDNKGEPNEGAVLCVGYDDDNDLYLKVEDGRGGDVSIWESHGDLPDGTLKTIRELIVERMEERKCSECGRPVFEGYIVWGGTEYYCSDECLHKHYTPQQWTEMSSGPAGREGDGNDVNYWTDWWEA